MEMNQKFKTDVEAVDSLRLAYENLSAEIQKVIIGQDKIVRDVIISIFSRGHCLLVGVPGLAKTLLVNTIADVLGLKYKRIQFTPDLMPSDIIGTEILDESRNFRFIQGPLFANIVLADEINRTPPKTQAALLEAMQERAITAAGKRYILDKPFFVLATQNPIEQEGTYPLPEAQLDRFMFNIWLDYPAFNDEITNKYINWGAGPRASQYLVLGAKTHAVLNGKYSPDIEDVKAIAMPILRHRLVKNYKAEAENISIENIIDELINS
jgi:MoxR-like ATPase